VSVHPADIQDRDGGLPVMAAAVEKSPTLEKTWADAAYRGRFVQKVKEDLNVEIEVVTRADAGGAAWQEEGTPPPKVNTGFKVLAWRWLVERTLAWIGRNRRLSKDYEGLPETSAAFVWVAAMRLLVTRLAVEGPQAEEAPSM
jgi:putative transposase